MKGKKITVIEFGYICKYKLQKTSPEWIDTGTTFSSIHEALAYLKHKNIRPEKIHIQKLKAKVQPLEMKNAKQKS
jgi:hypothetical protein